MREITSYWFDVQKRANIKVSLYYVQIPSQLFDLRAVCRGNNELFLVPWNKTLKYLNYFLLGFYSKVTKRKKPPKNPIICRQSNLITGQF